MNDLLNLFIYIDDYLIKSLYSVYLNGYIDIRTSKRICDNTLTGRFHIDENNRTYCGDGKTKIYNKGFKTSNRSNDFNETFFNGNDRSLENRVFGRSEEEIKRIYTSFELHNNMIFRMTNSNHLKDLSTPSFTDLNSLKEGDFIKLRGCISNISICSYLDSLISLIECFPEETLNKLLEGKNIGSLTYPILLKLLIKIKNALSSNNTQDIVMNCNGLNLVLSTNSKYFLNGECYVFDNGHCNVIGKVLKVCNDESCINLLRKLTQDDYYEKLFDSLLPYLEVLKELQIPIPDFPKIKINAPAILITPISMYF